ncbi:hypothetical protein [Streptomyces sp. WAC08241]|uniref:hypothetical protein n=1 Tax=Streptomyces sp. WAC08241 TaxID=2487421 RepID=UPI000F786A00|nr:hypothetical protein [Streptomyces sp. WAC08241]RSS41926.1 hypothetical protein EF906_13400 [Streptomyces sp. WAC08241]
MGVILWYLIDFPVLRLKVSNDVRSGSVLADAEIVVTYEIGEPGRFDITFADLPLDLHEKLTSALGEKKAGPEGGVDVDIHLGYLDDPSGRDVVLSGRVDAIKSTTRYPPLAIRLTGYEEASYRLLAHTDPGSDPPRAGFSLPGTTPHDAAKHIAGLAGVDVVGLPEPCAYLREITRTGKNAFALLRAVADQYGYEILVQDGTVQCGKTLAHPPAGRFPDVPPVAALAAAIGGEECLVVPKTMTLARLAEFKPARLGTVGRQPLDTGPKDPAEVEAFDFTVLGVPSLRAGMMVAAGVEGYEKPFRGFRILQLTHTFSPRGGYTCAGRAVEFDRDGGNARLSELARKATAHSIADLISGKVQEHAAVNPSVDVGVVDRAEPDRRTATVLSGQRPDEAMASPSVDVPVTGGDPTRRDKPVASPFAWHKVGLSVPVYAGMRALLNQVRDNPDDTVVAGFLWPNAPKTDRPKSKEGDWWLCLPTELTGGAGTALPTGKGVNDLIAADGRRVVEAIGLKVAIGEDACTAVGERPEEGSAEVFLLTHKSGTTVTIDADGSVTVDGGSHDVVLKSGGVTVTIGKGKVAIG